MSRSTKELTIICVVMVLLTLALCYAIAFADAAELPDPVLTPGALDPEVVDSSLTLDQLCHQSTKERRHVTQKDKDDTFAAYHLHQEHRPDCTGPAPKNNLTAHACFEIDHDCSLELGCNNVAKNRWAQAYETGEPPYPGQWGAHKKDDLENHLHHLICVSKTMTLQEAQLCISKDWIACYQEVMQ